jgi:inner-membrane translocator
VDSLLSAIISADFISSVLRLSTPILFAGLAALITDKAGVINIGLEGIMLSAALAGVVGSAFGGNAFIGLLLALVVGVAMGLLMAYFAIGLKTDIVLTGIALNLMASGGTVFLLYVITKDKGMSTSLKSFIMPVIQLPFIKSIPVLGDILSGHNLLTYLAFLFTVLVWILLYRTPLGLRIRVVGENISAAESVGIPVKKVQFIALAISGVLASMGGAYMSMGYMDKFARDMTAGRGFIALAAEALGRATPLGTLIASLFFGMVDALSSNLQILNVPVQFVQMLPYVCTIVGLVIYSAIKGRNKSN